MNAILLLQLRAQRALRPRRLNGGFSLTEAICALLVTAIVLGTIAPIVTLAVATRAQNRRVDQARFLAQLEIDRVRAEMTRGILVDEESSIVPPAVTNDDGSVGSAPAPTALEALRADIDNETDALLADIDSDGESDFFIQAVRSPGVRFRAGSSEDQLAVFEMMVRVYDISAQQNLGTGLSTDAAYIGLVNGIGQRETNPLAEVHSVIGRSDLSLSLLEYADFICETNPSLSDCS